MTLDDKTRQKWIKNELETCIHFNGVQNKTCRGGFVIPQADRENAIPCMPRFFNGRNVLECSGFRLPTQTEAESEVAERERLLGRTDAAFRVAHDHAKSEGLGRGNGGFRQIECPVCKGNLKYSVASVNGHMHAHCDTEGCVSWME